MFNRPGDTSQQKQSFPIKRLNCSKLQLPIISNRTYQHKNSLCTFPERERKKQVVFIHDFDLHKCPSLGQFPPSFWPGQQFRISGIVLFNHGSSYRDQAPSNCTVSSHNHKHLQTCSWFNTNQFELASRSRRILSHLKTFDRLKAQWRLALGDQGSI